MCEVVVLCAASRFAEPRSFLRRRTACHFLHCAKSNIKSTRDSVLRPRFKALPEKILAELSGNTSRTRFFAQDGGEKALNRCEVPALQRKELERRLKEKPCSLRTVGYGWVGMGDGGWKRVAWGGDKKGFLQMKTFSVCAKGRLLSAFRNVFCKRKRFCFAKKAAFSIHAKPTDKEKLFFSTAKFQFRTAPKLTCSHKFHL